MFAKNRFTLTTAALLMALVSSALWTVPALADDGAPPPPTDSPTGVAPPDDVPPMSVAPVEAATSEPVPEPAAAPATLPELLGQLPEGTNVVVTDAAGEALPLASQEAANTSTSGDPMWCPAGVKPGAGSCSPGFAKFGNTADVFLDLIDWLDTHDPSKAGVIWIEFNYDNTLETLPNNDVVIDGSEFANLYKYSLTLQGGWNGLNGSTALNPIIPYSTFNGSLNILNWAGNVTLNDILINGNSNSGSTTQALDVNTTRNILLNRVTVQDSLNTGAGGMNGALLDNYLSGAGSGTVIVNNSVFDHNEGSGLLINSNNMVTTTNLMADRNGQDGLSINNISTLGDKAVTLKGVKQFNLNSGDGLRIVSDGLITLANVVAANNAGGYGAYLDNTTSTAHLGITIGGTNSFTNNGSAGLHVVSNGRITASNLNASGNSGDGVSLDNCEWNGSYCLALPGKTVKVSGTNIFTNNTGVGLGIRSLGSITVNNLTALYNGDTGAVFQNEYKDNTALHKDSSGTLTLTGYASFDNNNGDGLYGESYGSFKAANLTASFNHGASTGRGVYLYLYKGATLAGINAFFNNTGSGLILTGFGKISANNVSADNNGKYGADFNADNASLTLTGTNSFNSNGDDGLHLLGLGIVMLSNVTANSNNGKGADIDNIVDPTKLYNVTLKGTNLFSDNYDTGLDVSSLGAILINNLTATNNGVLFGYGAQMLNGGILPGTPRPVTFTGYVHTSSNHFAGLTISSRGAITLSNVIATANGYEGALINNHFDPAKPMNVTVKGVNTFSANGGDGLNASSYGTITLSNITANNNVGDGAYLNNATGSLTPRNIILTGVNNFSYNGHDGLYFNASGSVVLSRVNASWNDGIADAYFGDGIKGTAGGSIMLVCGQMISNLDGRGYDLTAAGPLIIKGIYTYFNGLADAHIGSTLTVIYPCALP